MVAQDADHAWEYSVVVVLLWCMYRARTLSRSEQESSSTFSCLPAQNQFPAQHYGFGRDSRGESPTLIFSAQTLTIMQRRDQGEQDRRICELEVGGNEYYSI